MWAVVVCLAALLPVQAIALDPARAVTQYLHRGWDSDHGLPQNSVFALAQTPDGLMWVGTWEGLARFDGAGFQVFDRRNTPAFKLNGVISLAVDPSGALWIGTEEGLLLRRGEQIERVPHPELESARVNALTFSRDGSLWVGTNKGLFRLQGDTLVPQVLPFGPAGRPYIVSLGEDRAGALWIGTGRSLLRLYRNEITAPLSDFEHPGVMVSPARDGGVWLAHGGKQPGVAHANGDVVERLPLTFKAAMASVLEDRHGTLWLGTSSGLYRWDGVALEKLPLSRSGLDEVFALFESSDGGLFVGTAASALHRLSDSPMVVFGAPEGLAGDPTFPILEDRSGAVWIGSHDGLNRVRAGKVETFGPAQGLGAEFIRTLTESPSGELYIGAANGVFRHADGRFGAVPGLESVMVFAISSDTSGALWVATPAGLIEYRNGRIERTIGVPQGLPKGPIHRIFEDSKQRLWVGASAGLFEISDGSAKKAWPEAERSEAVLDLHEGPGGELWMGTLRGLGLWREGMPVTLITSRQGMFDEAVFRILADQNDNLWMSCNRGIFRMSRRELLAVASGELEVAAHRAFDRTDGMRSPECNGTAQPSGTRTRDGRLWFPTLRGAVSFDPANPALVRSLPSTQIDGVVAGGERMAAGEALSFTPEVRDVDVHFTAPSFDDGDSLVFRYRLVGHDASWVDAGKRRVAHYANLRPGTYRFEVQVSRDGETFGSSAVLPLQFKARWVETLWFYGVLAVLGVLMACLAYAARIRQLKAHERELEARVAARTTELASANAELDDQMRTLRTTQAQLVEAGKLAAVGTLAAGVGHEINNPLAYIVSNLHFARSEVDALDRARTPELRKEASDEIQQALEEALQGADKVRRIVQDLKTFSRRDEEEKPTALDLHGVLDSAAKMATGELRHRAQLVRDYTALPKVEANGARLGQVFLNLLVNAAHALPEGRASQNEVRLVTRHEDEWVVVEVRDSGSGMPPEVLARIFEPFFTTKPVGVGTGLGLSLCRTYLQAMGGSIEAESVVGRGSTFRIRLRVAAREPELLREVSREAVPVENARARILVIDDDSLVIAALKRSLKDSHEVEARISARAALATLTAPELPYDLVLCDLMMPEMTGMELFRELSRTHPRRAQELVFVTGGAFTEQSREFLATVDNLRLEKPFDVQHLRTLIAQRLQRARSARHAA